VIFQYGVVTDGGWLLTFAVFKVSQNEYELGGVLEGDPAGLPHRDEIALLVLVNYDDGQRVLPVAAGQIVGGLKVVDLVHGHRFASVNVRRRGD